MEHGQTIEFLIKNPITNTEEFYSTLEELVNYFHKYKQTKGEMLVRDFPEVKINYNLETGKVEIIGLDNPRGVTNFFNPKTFSHYIKPIVDAIAIFAKINLLNHLALSDEKISSIINHQLYMKQRQKIKLANITVAIKAITEELKKPKYRLFGEESKNIERSQLAKALANIEKIKSLHDVEKVLKHTHPSQSTQTKKIL